MIFCTEALENTLYYRTHEKGAIGGNTVFVSLPSHPNAGKLLPALLTCSPLEITQSAILLQAAMKEDDIWKQRWKPAVKKHALSRDLFWVRWQNICLQRRQASEEPVGRPPSGGGRLQILHQLVQRLSRASGGEQLLLFNQLLAAFGFSQESIGRAQLLLLSTEQEKPLLFLA